MNNQNNLSMEDALRIKSAELWLGIGEPTQALLELQDLTIVASKHPWTGRVKARAAKAMGVGKRRSTRRSQTRHCFALPRALG